MRKKLIIWIVISLLTVFAFLTWYKFKYSMDIARSFEVNTTQAKYKVLIASQGSDFKDAVVAGVVEHLKQQDVYIKAIDVTMLPQINDQQWHAIVVMHTWENLKPQVDADEFIKRVKNINDVVVLSTSGTGGHKIEGVDAISSASKIADIPTRIQEISMRLDSILNRE